MGFSGPPTYLEALDKSLRRFLESLGEALELRAGFSCGIGFCSADAEVAAVCGPDA